MTGIMMIMIGRKINLLKNVFLIYNESKLFFYGRKSKKSYKVGDEIEVKIIKVDILEYQIDLELT